jgi:exo-beta-1,3-glucanase (GH17 family)
VAYQPRNFVPGPDATLSQEQIREDLRLLRNVGFRSLVTYGAVGNLGAIPELARREGFDGTVIMGIWDPFSNEEWANALKQAPFVDGYCLGNEGLGKRYSPDELETSFAALRRSTGRPVTTSEPLDDYLAGSHREWLLSHSDWLFPVAQPFLAGQSDPVRASDWILTRHDYLVAHSPLRIILKEAGFPSWGAEGASPETQRSFFQRLGSTGTDFFFFEAFDQPWKVNTISPSEVEAHWGLFERDRTPKAILLWLQKQGARD